MRLIIRLIILGFQFLEETKLDDQVSNALAEIPQQVSKPKKKAAKSELQDDIPASQREKVSIS